MAESKLQIVTANRLTDGAVIYLDRNGEWSLSIGDARVARDKEEAEGLLAHAQRPGQGVVAVAVYLMEVREEGGEIVPVGVRETIRAQGPSALSDTSRQPGAA